MGPGGAEGQGGEERTLVDAAVVPPVAGRPARLPLYDLADFLRRLALPRSVRNWTLTTLRGKLIKVGSRVVRHAKAVTFR